MLTTGAKIAYESLGFVFASRVVNGKGDVALQNVQIRIGGPRELTLCFIRPASPRRLLAKERCLSPSFASGTWNVVGGSIGFLYCKLDRKMLRMRRCR
eukprot:SAG11_NODE_2874_length_2880_cov_2.944624_4_plen_98_part_00